LKKMTSLDSSEALLRLETMERMDLVGRRVRLSNGEEGPIVHVEYEPPQRVALVKTFEENPSPFTRVAVDRLSPSHLPYLLEIELESPPSQGSGSPA
jgi:hypothetical protein